MALFPGLELLATAVVALDGRLAVRYANPAAENLLAVGEKSLAGQPFAALFDEREALERTLAEARRSHWDYAAQNATYSRTHAELACVVTRVDAPQAALLVELRPIEQHLRLAREERLLAEQRANRELIRNLAHEIKNPLGGLRGSAQLLERELERPELREYTQVIIKEADRLQKLVDRMLTPQRAPRLAPVGIHEVLEHVRSLVEAEFAVEVLRDYDPSLPEVLGDREQLIQAALNIARNAAQAGAKRIALRSRALRQVTLLRQRHRLALEVQIADDGPGVPDELRERIFNPLVSGREGGSGLGLSLAQSLVQQHGGVIEFASAPGHTVFRILLPLA